VIRLAMITLASNAMACLDGDTEKVIAAGGGVNLSGIIAFIGDSNAVGQGSTDQADKGFAVTTAHATLTHNATYAVGAGDPPTMVNVSTQALQPYATGAVAGFGYEIEMGRELFREGHTPFLVKFAISGTTATDYKTASTYPGSGGNLMTRLKAYLDARITESGKTISAIVLSLGTNDASNATIAGNYGTNLANIIGELRTTYGADIPIIIPKLNSGCTNTHTNTVRTAQVAYAASDANAVLVNNDDIVLTDGFH
jgi:hypothetical protein